MAILFSAPAVCNDQVLQLSDSGAFYETFLDSPPTKTTTRGVVGASVVGLRWAGAAASFDPSVVQVNLGETIKQDETLCVRVLSRDGRYFARAQYKLAGMKATSPLIEFRTNYRKELNNYRSDDLAISAVAGRNCNDEKNVQRYAISHGAIADTKQVVVQVRAGDARVRAQLGMNGVATGPAVLCEQPTTSPTVGFTAECNLPVPQPFKAGVYQLSIGETGSGGEMAVKTMPIVLGAASR